ncbi:MAG: NAD(P)-binding domain-containing protein [Trebonia sp.]
MSGVSFIGLGNMTRAMAVRAVQGGNAVEVIRRDAAKARDLAAALGGGATAGTFGAASCGGSRYPASSDASAVRCLP